MDDAKRLKGCKHHWLGLAIPFWYSETPGRKRRSFNVFRERAKICLLVVVVHIGMCVTLYEPQRVWQVRSKGHDHMLRSLPVDYSQLEA